MTDAERRSAYKLLAMSEAWITVKRDLVLFAASERDTAVRCGRQDVLTYIEDSMIGLPEEN